MKDNWNDPSARTHPTLLGCWLTLASAAAAEALAHVGFDWLLIDTEHAPNDTKDVAEQLRAIDAARAHGASPDVAVRVAWNDPVLVKRVMDCGAQTIFFPTIDTVEQARRAVASTRFPDGANGGTRGVAGLVRGGKFGMDPAYVPAANAKACAVVQIESVTAVENVEEISQVEGVDCLFIGPADLSASLGQIGKGRSPVLLQAIDRVLRACEHAGKPAGIFAADVEEAAFYRGRGISVIALHSDVAWLTRGATSAIKSFEEFRNA
ncbi:MULTISPECIES: HpcH/HpaI aldolase family protein [Burkholderia]|uniref:HpcH/HpaI aldolase family protein n=1 Tax=Burkholderia TaxID=32008 RepID=UPI00186790E1|nr:MULTISPECIES: aldolase/citrate lyase family protein [Burkholderia]MBE2966689.1 2-dehydro-3-deoxyglucarate aldolase [Burkholderia cepacia]